SKNMSHSLWKISPLFSGVCLLAFTIVGTAIVTGRPAAKEPSPTTEVRGDTTPSTRPVHTFSIVARDPATGELGAAVQSHWFSVGSSVIWAEPGVGAVATQSFIEPSYGPLGLALMRGGKRASEALKALLASDPFRSGRQVAMIDSTGEAAAF